MTKKRAVAARRQPDRKCKRGTAVRPISKKNRRSLFDALPDEAIDNVVRFTSEKPHLPEWTSFVKSHIVYSLIKSGGVISSSSSRLFRKLDVKNTVPTHRRGVVVLSAGHSSRRHFDNMLSAVGENLTELRVNRDNFPATWSRSLVKSCPNIKRLSLTMRSEKNRHRLDDILSGLSGKLESLELSWFSLNIPEISAIAKHGKGLQCLSLMFRRINGPLEGIWRNVGRSLKDLRVLAIEGSANLTARDFKFVNLKKLSVHCKSLSRLSIECLPASMHQDLAELAIAYGIQLEALQVNWCRFKPPHINQVIKACPNIKFDVKEGCGPSTPSLVAMGPHASSVNIGCDTVEDWSGMPEKNLTLVSERCPNLEAVTIWCENVPDCAFGCLFSCPKPLLREFRAKYVQQRLTARVLEVLAEKATGLELFELSGSLPPMSMLRKFAEKSGRLSKVILSDIVNGGLCVCNIHNHDDPNFEKRELKKDANFGTAVEIFLGCPTVCELSFDCHRADHVPQTEQVDEFVDICHAARMKSVSVTICGCHYV